jgi:Ca2+:H+ antiporter
MTFLVRRIALCRASYNKEVLEFNSALAKTLSSLMMITAVTMLLPTAVSRVISPPVELS